VTPGLRVVRSNRMERLVDALAETVAEPLPDPLAPEVVVVQNRGMARWVSQRLADRFGAWMNARFPFPNAAVDEWFEAVLGPADPTRPWDPDVLVWRILEALPGCLDRPAFEPLARFLAADDRPRRRYRLASRLADLFDRYTVYRPDWVLGWERREGGPEGADWQAELWRDLVARIGPGHRARRWQEFLQELERGPPQGLPARVQVFGISALPPFHLEVLSALARYLPVTVFVLDPCREYWADIVSEAEAARRVRAAPGTEGYYATGNRLLASLGRSGRGFLDLLLEFDPADHDRFVEPDPTTALGWLQSDILHLRDRAPDDRVPWPAGDRSLAVASCHSPLREVEALRDHLLHLFDTLPDLLPEDVVVMTPDPDTYGPLVSAVFRGEEGVPALPHSLADLGASAGGGPAAGFLRLLKVAGGRLRAPEVMDLLEWPALRRRFGWAEDDLERVRVWAAEAGVRWGRDQAHREALGVGGYGEHSWRFGLDRLVLGRALGPGADELWAGVHPYPDVEGGEDAAGLEKLLRFCTDLFGLARDLSRDRPPAEWSRALGAWFDRFFLPEGAEEREAQTLRRALARLAEAGTTGPVSFDAVAEHLAAEVGQRGREGGFLQGGVTVCAMLPMRSVPFRVVCLLGMSDGAFPRVDRPAGFDLIDRHPRRGDRSIRDEDRYVFLEALLSARDHLYVSYVGQSQRDNAEIPPSVLVSELLEALDRTFRPHEGWRPSDLVTVRHRLHPFSPAYFRGGEGLFSYSAANEAAARRLADPQGRKVRGPWAEAEIPAGPEAVEGLTVEDLVGFFRNPADRFLRARFGIRLDRVGGILEDAEPLEPDALARYGLAEELLARMAGGGSVSEALPVMRAQGRLPPGGAAPVAFLRAEAVARQVWEHAARRMAEGPADVEPQDLVLGSYRLHLRLIGVRSTGLVLFRPAAPKAKDRVRAWIWHLALCVVAPAGVARETAVVGTEGKGWVFGPVDEPEAHLRTLVDLYAGGLTRPVPFAPETSWAYARARWQRGKPRSEALQAARGAWAGSSFAVGDRQDPALYHCFGEEGPVSAEGFEEVAEAVFRPTLAYERGRP